MDAYGVSALQFGRFDLRLTGAIHPGAVLVLPSSKQGKRQKFVVGDAQGTVTCFAMGEKSNALEEQWKVSLPSAHGSAAPAVTAFTLGGLKDPKDQLYVSCDRTITGLKKTGKEFFRFPTLILNTIGSLSVNNLSLFAVSDFTYTRFTETKEVEVFTAGERVTCLHPLVGRFQRPIANPHVPLPPPPPPRVYPAVLSTPETLAPAVLLGSADRFVSLIRSGRVVAQVKLPAASSCFCEVPAPLGVVPGPIDAANGREDTDASQTLRYIVFGTSGGHLGLLTADVTAGTLTCGPTVLLQRPPSSSSLALASSAAGAADAVFDSLVARNPLRPGLRADDEEASNAAKAAKTAADTAIAAAAAAAAAVAESPSASPASPVAWHRQAGARAAGALTDAITCLALADVTDKAGTDLAVATAAGVVQVLSLGPDGFVRTLEADAAPAAGDDASATTTSAAAATVLAIAPGAVLWHRDLNDRVTNLVAGCLYARERHDLLLTTFSGKLLLFSTDADSSVASLREAAKVALAETKANAAAAAAAAAATAGGAGSGIGFGMMTPSEEATWIDNHCYDTLQADISALKRIIAEKKERFARVNDAGLVAFNTPLNVKVSFILDPDAGLYRLSVESEFMVEALYIVSTAAISVTPLGSDAVDTMLSYTPVPTNAHARSGTPGSGSGTGTGPTSQASQAETQQLLLTVKLPPHTQRFAADVCTIERAGAAGEFAVFVVPKLEPKRSQRFAFPVLPLSLHTPATHAASGEPIAAPAAISGGGGDAAAARSPVLLPRDLAARFAAGRVNLLTVSGAPLQTALTHRWLRGLLPGLAPLPAYVDPAATTAAPASTVAPAAAAAAAAAGAGCKPLASLAPGAPLSIAGLEEPACAFYQACDVPTVLGIVYGNGKAVFASDSVATISVIKDFLAQQATVERIRLATSLTLAPSTLGLSLARAKPLLYRQLELPRAAALGRALAEAAAQDPLLRSLLTPDLKAMLTVAEAPESAAAADLFASGSSGSGGKPKVVYPATVPALESDSREVKIAAVQPLAAPAPTGVDMATRGRDWILTAYDAWFKLSGQLPKGRELLAKLLTPEGYDWAEIEGLFTQAATPN